VDGNFVTADGTVPAGQQVVNELLSRCQQWAEMVLERYSVLLEITPLAFPDILQAWGI
jgi:hypothetical protein